MEIKRIKSEKANWQQVKEMAKAGEDGLHVGDEILDTLKDFIGSDIFQQEITYVVAHITENEVHFISKDCLIENVAWNEQGSTDGGFRKSSLCQYLNTEVWKKLPAELRAVIDERECLQIVNGKEERFPLKLWLPTEYEVFDDTLDSEAQEGEQFEIFKDRRNRIKEVVDGGGTGWWLLSAMRYPFDGACFITPDGYALCSNCTTKLRMPVCFTIKR